MVEPPLSRIIVVGAGPAGARCADRLAVGGASVTLIGGEAAHPYNRVALSQFLAGDLDEASLVTHHPDHLSERLIEWRPDTRVVALDRPARQAVLESGERVAYDRLVLATGAQAVRLPLPGRGPGACLDVPDAQRRAADDRARGHWR